MNRTKKVIVSIILCFTVILTCGLSACGLHDSPPYDDRASYLSDLIMKNESDLTLTERNLLFDISELPKASYSSESEFLQLSSTVRAEYTFYNDAETEVKEKIFFATGSTPDYGVIDDNDNQITPNDISRYDVLIDYTPVDFNVRHFLPREYVYGEFYEYFTDSFYFDQNLSPDTVVKKYTFTLSDEYFSNGNAYVCAPYDALGYENFLLEDYIGNLYFKNKYFITTLVSNSSFSLYVIGNQAFDTATLSWTVRDVSRDDAGNYPQLPVTVNLTSTKTLTYKQLALSNRPQNSQISEVDWYNAVTLNCLEDHDASSLDVSNIIIKYLSYDMTVPAMSSVKTTISAPVYPVVYKTSTPYAYNYSFTLNDTDFYTNDLNVYLRTPFYIVTDTDFYNSVDRQKTDDGYKLSYDVGYGTISFTLCSAENPVTQSDRNAERSKKIVLLVFSMLVFISITPGVAIIFIVVHFKKKEKQFREKMAKKKLAEKQINSPPNEQSE